MNEINEIVMVGGQTRMPKIVDEVKKVFGKTPNLTISALSPTTICYTDSVILKANLTGDTLTNYTYEWMPDYIYGDTTYMAQHSGSF